jgi:GTPase Era involved in 16S rRNA processing
MGADGYELIKQKSETVASALRDIAVLIGKPGAQPVTFEKGETVAPGLGLVSDASNLAKRAHDIQQGIFKIIVLGEFKNGKSTLLNAVLGSKTLPARALPCTAVITELVHGNSKDVVIYEADQDTPRTLPWEAFVEEFKLTEKDIQTLENHNHLDRFQNVEYVRLECLHPFCANGIKLIDSPGLGEHVSRTRVTTNFLKQAQAVIFVLNATKILSQDEKVFIEKVFGSGRFSHVFFVVNRINQIDEEDVPGIEQWVRESLKHHFLDDGSQFDEAFYNRRVFFVNAKGALDARTQKEDALLESSGVPALERELERFLTSEEKVFAALEFTVQLLTQIISAARQDIAQQKVALEQPLAELEAARVECEGRLKALEGQKEDIERTIFLYKEMTKQKIYGNLLGYINEMHETWPIDSNQLINLDEVHLGKVLLSFVSNDAKQKISEAVEREVQSYLEIKLTEWAERIPTIVQADIDEMMKEVEAQVGDFQLELARIGNIFAGAKGEEVIDIDKNRAAKVIQLVLGFGDISQMTGAVMGKGDWGSFFGRLLQQILTLVAIFSLFSGPIAWIAVFVVEAALIGGQHNQLKQRILESLGSKLNENLQKELPNKQDEIYQGVEKQFTQFAQRLTQVLQDQINETREGQETILRQKRDASFSVEQEKQRLDKIADLLLERLNRVSLAAGGQPLAADDLDRMKEVV